MTNSQLSHGKSAAGRKTKNQVIPLENLTMEDINFPEFCFGVIGKVPLKDQPDELIFVDRLNPDAKISIVKSKFGLPTQFTRDLRLALIKLAMRKNGFSSEMTEATASEIIREMGIVESGENFKLVRKHLDILVNTRIKFFKSYFDKEEKRTVNTELDFSILQGYLISEPKKTKAGDSFKGYFLWQKFFFENSIKNAKNLIDLDYSLYTGLKGDITKQLYSFLNKRSYGKLEFRINLDVLAYTKLGISPERSLSKVRFDLKKAHQNLLESGFLARLPEYIKSPGNPETIIYYFSGNTLSLNSDSLFGDDSRETPLREDLYKLGFTDGQIGKMSRDYSFSQLVDAVDLYMLESKKTKILDPKKWIFACLKRGFDMTDLEKARASMKKDEQQIQSMVTEVEVSLTGSDNKQNEELAVQERERAILEWINSNPETYDQMCLDLYHKLQKQNQKFFVDLIETNASKAGKSISEFIKSHSILRSMVNAEVGQSLNL